MDNKIKETEDIKSLSKMLTEENKPYVIAVANALLFTQQEKDKKASYTQSFNRIT